eukprot:2215854-Rhodomonas_salina.1
MRVTCVLDCAQSSAPTTRYIDPSYMVRSVAANVGDAQYCSLLASQAVHAAFAGFTGFTVGLINNRSVSVAVFVIVAVFVSVSVSGSGSRSVSGCVYVYVYVSVFVRVRVRDCLAAFLPVCARRDDDVAPPYLSRAALARATCFAHAHAARDAGACCCIPARACGRLHAVPRGGSDEGCAGSRSVLIPMWMIAGQNRKVDTSGRFWFRVLSSTGQPDLESAAVQSARA